MTERKTAETGQYLSFTLSQQTFGIPIETVREINQLPKITSVPNTPPCVVGIINLRGKVIPVVDLRLKFKLPLQAFKRETCVIVVDLEQGQVAIIVDTVASVISVRKEQVDAPSVLIQDASNQAIAGLARFPDQLIILIDIHFIMSQDSIYNIAELSQAIAESNEANPLVKSAS